MKIIAFTGTRDGVTPAQLASLHLLIAEESGTEPCEYQHGQCVGADAAFDAAVMDLALPGSVVVARPSDIPAMRAELPEPRDGITRVFHDPERPLVRNRKLAGACDVLIACPKGPEELRSGTWATVRAARKLGKPVRAAWPDGRITNEGKV